MNKLDFAPTESLATSFMRNHPRLKQIVQVFQHHLFAEYFKKRVKIDVVDQPGPGARHTSDLNSFGFDSVSEKKVGR